MVLKIVAAGILKEHVMSLERMEVVMAESLVAAFGVLENRRRSDVSTVEIETVSAGAMKDIIAVDDGATV